MEDNITSQNGFEAWGAQAFVGENYSFYKNKWKDRDGEKSFTSWHWAAFFLGTWWLIYRKMYGTAAIYFVLSLLLLITGPIALVLRIVLAIYANAMYRNKARKVFEKYDDMPEEEAKVFLKRAGGTNVLGAIVAFVCYVVLILGGLVYIGFQVPDGMDTVPLLPLQSVTTKDGTVTLQVPEDFEVVDDGNQDLYCNWEQRDIAFTVYVFEKEDYTADVTNRSIMEKQIEYTKEQEYDMEKITDKAMPSLGDDFAQQLNETTWDTGAKYYMYFTSKTLPDKWVVILFVTKPSKWTQDQELFKQIAESAQLTTARSASEQ